MADAAPYRQEADSVRGAQKAQKRQSRGIAADWLLKDNGENIFALAIGGLVGNYIATYVGSWTFNDVGEQLQGIPGMFSEVSNGWR